MKRVLALDTSSRTGSIALLEDGRVTAEWTWESTDARSARLLDDARRVLERRGLGPADVDLYATSIGPGSFTGIRIAMATAKGLAWASGRPLAGVCSLEALARPLLGRGAPVLAAFDARRGQVYAALYDAAGATLLAPVVRDPARLAAEAAACAPDGPVLCAGDGPGAYPAAFAEGLGGRVVRAAPWEDAVRAAVVGAIALERAAAGLREDVASVEPMYLRRSEAEEKRAARLGEVPT